MHKLFVRFLLVVLIVSMFTTPGQTASAQAIALPAEMNKTFTPIRIAAGGTSLLRITIFNPNPFALTSAAWTDTMPSNITIAGLQSNSCGGTASAPAGTSTISLTGGTVPAQSGSTPGSCTVAVNVTSAVAGNWINTIPAGRLSSSGPGGISVTTTSPASATLNVTGAGTPTVSKNFNPSNIWAGGVSQLTITITNNANTTLTGTTLPDTLPANVIFATPASSTLTGCGGSATTAIAGNTITLNNGTIAPAGTCTITVNVTGNVQGAYTNTIPANRLGNNQNLTNSSPASARLTVRELGLTKRFNPPTLSAGGTTTLIITLQNPKSTAYTGVSFTDTLPAPMTASSVSTNSCGGTVSITPSTAVALSGGTIPTGSPTTPGTCTIEVVVSVPAGTASGTLTNRIAPGALTTAQGVGNLTAATANVTVSGTQVSGTKSFSPSTIPVGGNSRLRVDIFAPSDTNLTNFSVTDPLPTGISVSNSTPAAVTGCGAAASLNAATGATTVSLTGGTILSGQRCRIDVYVTSSTPTPAGTPYTNTILPTNISNNEGRVPTNSLTANLTVSGAGTLSISLVKGFEPPQVFGGAASTMSIDIINPGTVPFTGITFTDTMPNGMILANPTNFNVGTCGGTITGNPGDNTFVFAGGALPALGSCTLTLSATMTVNGNLTNTIPAGAIRTDGNLATNADPTSASLTNLPGASVSKAFAPNPIPTGSYSLLTITVQNTGNIGLSGMEVSDSLPSGLEIAGGSAPAPVNNCGGTLTAVSGTQLIQLVNGVLAGNATCTMVVAITGSNPGDFQNTIPAGNLRADPNTRNTSPATATLTITGEPVAASGGGRGGGGTRVPRTRPVSNATTFLIPVTAGFAPGMETKLDVASRQSYDATGLSIDIPDLKLKTSIVGVESKKSGWDISWLQSEVGWLNGTAYPTWKGNSVLTAHVVNADGKPGLFYNLKALGVGEYVYVYNAGYRYTYQVVSNTFVKQDDSSLMKHEDKPYLTLFTCDTYDAATGKYLRYVEVRAVLVDVRQVR